ncbi:MAG TPA: stage III sporulation protein AE [Clostridia bacterium]|nr:stage III sporulation protein AE [Clostridia bacterium]
MQRILFVITMLLCILVLVPGNAFADLENDESLYSAFDLTELNTESIQNFIDGLDEEVKSVVPALNFKEMIFLLATGELDLSVNDILNLVLSQFFKDVVANMSLMGKLVILAVICALLQNLSAAFERATTGKLTYSVVYLALITIAVSSFTMVLSTGSGAIDSMVGFLQLLMPLILTFLVGVGAVASTAIFHPVIFMAVSVTGTIVKNIVFPLIFFAAILSIISNLSEKFQVSSLAGLFKTVAMGFMGLLTTVFLGVLSIKGVAAAVADGVVIRTAKFATRSFVPVVGGMFSDALESVVSTSLLIKNALGLGGVIMIFFLALIPLLEILAVAFVYKLAGALIQPIGDPRLVDCLNTLGNSLLLVFAAVGTTCLLFFFAVAITVGIGDLTVMLR